MLSCAVLLLMSTPLASPGVVSPGASAVMAEPSPDSQSVLVTASRGTASDGLRRIVDAELASLLPGIEGLEFITAGDLGRRMSLEGERQRYDCGSDLTACMAEISGALGVPWAVFVDVDVLDDTATIAMTVLGEDGTALGRELVRTPVSGVSVGADLRPALARLMRPVQRAAGVVVVEAPPGPSAWLVGGGVGIGVGVVVAAIGLMPLVAHASASSSLTALRADSDGDVDGALDQAAPYQQAQQQAAADWDQWGLPAVIVGAVLVGVGATALGVSALENP